MQINKPTLIAVSSPFQCICALEAIRVFSIHDYDMCVICNKGKRLEQIQGILKQFDIKAIYIPSPDYFVFIIKYIFFYRHIVNRKYDFGLCGDFKNVNLKLLLSRFLKRKAKIMYLDDGFTSIYPLNNIVYKDLKIQIRELAYKLYRSINGINDRFYFSIFKGTTTKYTIYNNELKVLQVPMDIPKRGIYILGTVTQFVDSILPNKNFCDYFKATIEFVKQKYPYQPIFYSPHARTIDTKLMKKVCEEYGINTIVSTFSVEIDYSYNQYNPCAILGFGSTALITLKKIYTKADIINVFLPSKIELYANKNRFINDYLQKESIITIEVL